MRQVKGKSDRVARKLVAVILAVSYALAARAGAGDLKPKTLEAFDHHVLLTDAQMESESARHGSYLRVESLPQDRPKATAAQFGRKTGGDRTPGAAREPRGFRKKWITLGEWASAWNRSRTIAVFSGT